MAQPPTIEIVRGVPLRLVDNGDGSYSVATVTVSGGAGPDALWPLTRNLPVRLTAIGDGSYAIATAPSTGSSVVAAVDYTGATNATSSLQAVLDAASARAAARHGTFGTEEVQLLPGFVKVSGLVIPSHVNVRCNGTELIAGGSGTMISMPGSICGLSGAHLSGGGVGAGANGIVTSGNHARLDHLIFDNFAGRAVLLGGLANSVSEIFAQGCLQDTASLSAKTGVFELTGSDCQIFGNVEIAGSRSSLSSVNAYVCAFAATGGGANHISGLLAEQGDVGIYINNDGDLYVGCIADINRGNGWELNGGGATIVACVARRNSAETHNTYDGFKVVGSGAFHFSACLAAAAATAHKYGFNDTSAHSPPASKFDALCKSTGHATTAFNTVGGNNGPAIDFGWSEWVGRTGATPSVEGLSSVKLANGGATTLTNFLGGVGGQRLLVWGDGVTTLQHLPSIVMSAGTNLLLAANRSTEFVNVNGAWRQIG